MDVQGCYKRQAK